MMQEYSRALGNAIRHARTSQGLTQKQLADKLNIDERTIMNIERFRANTTMEILYPMIRVLNIDPRDIFNPETESHSRNHYQLRVIVDDCSEEEAAVLISVCRSVITALRSKETISI